MERVPHPIPTVAIRTDAFCYGPLVERLSPVDLASSERAQRWSDAGAPTVYLASDIGVALAEWGRHVPVDDGRDDSALWRVPVQLARAVDLRRPEAVARAVPDEAWPVDLDEEPHWYLDQEVTRSISAWLRYEVGVDGLIVPSVAFLDDRARGNLVVFVDDAAPIERRLGEPRPVASVRWSDRSAVDADLDTRLQVPGEPALLRV